VSRTAASVLHHVLADPSRIASHDWQDICAEFSPARLAQVARWLGCYLPVARHQKIRRAVFRSMAGRIARAAVTAEPQVTISKTYGGTTVKFGVFEKAISRFALDLYKAEGFAHEPHVVRYLHDTVDRGTLVVDVGAHFICGLALAWPDGHIEYFEGRVDGELTWPPRGEKGFGYDPIFIPEGHDITFGEMEPDAKHAMSHRADAFRQLVNACFAK
jgi:hypothetical protein